MFQENDDGTTKERLNRPVIGVVATPTNADAVARSLLRAKRHGYPTMVVIAGDQNVESVTVATQLGCHLVNRESPQDGFRSLRTDLARSAKRRGFPGVIFHQTPTERLDYDRSEERFLRSDDYIVDGATTTISNKVSVLVGIPVYNEEDSIGEVIEQASVYADAVLVVDDGSDDESAELACSAGADVIVHERNQGYGSALRTLFREAAVLQVDHLVVIDGDGQHDPTDVPRLVAAQRQTDVELVIGSRFVDNVDNQIPRYRRFGLLMITILTNLSFGVVRPNSWITDSQSGFRAYDARIIKSLAVDSTLGDSMDASTDILNHAHRNNYDIEEVGTTISYDVPNGSSLNPIHHGIVLVRNILKTVERERPMTILGAPGFAGALIGFGFGYWTFINYVQTGTFPVGLAITSVLFLLSGIFACFTAIILHSLGTQIGGVNG
ncbi:glycosyltransferase family 2 protein [Haladaptatus sp. CMAA 1911]|uniref:glycosyltransferase family 2 protein n=1 Tax=unclassified Haladaptatus TaxID=2622732 RepID=UPI0037552A7B